MPASSSTSASIVAGATVAAALGLSAGCLLRQRRARARAFGTFGRFPGRVRPGPTRCVVSFPARHVHEWKTIERAAREVNIACSWSGGRAEPESVWRAN
eukprot:6391586-Prymnesium_polylepis.1